MAKNGTGSSGSTALDLPARELATESLPPPPPESATPEEKDLYWYTHVYQGDRTPQLTFRAVAMGAVLGMLMSVSNLYTDAQGRLVVRRRHHLVRPVVRHLERVPNALGRTPLAHVDPREQLHAVDRVGGWLLHRLDHRDRLRRAAADRSRSIATIRGTSSARSRC